MRKEIETKKMRDVMTKHPITVSPNMTIRELKTMFEAHDFIMFPVVNGRGLCSGVVTKLDLLRTLSATAALLDSGPAAAVG